MGSEFMNRISRSKKVKRGFRISDPENLKSINISAIFTAKKAIRGGWFRMSASIFHAVYGFLNISGRPCEKPTQDFHYGRPF
jgi:hypothetical protein